MSSPLGKIGAWAAEAERADAEEREQAAAAAVAAAAASGGDAQSFPSLRDSVSNKQTKKKTKMSLHEFTMQGIGPGGGGGGRGLTPDEMLRLPTGPKERSAEEMQDGRLGGGFSSYGGGRSGRIRDRDMEGDGPWGGNRRSYGRFDDDRRGPPPRVSDFDEPSRADEADNWALGKKSLPQFDSGRPNRYGSLGSGGGGGIGIWTGGGISRADEVDNWGAGKKSMPLRSSNFGSGFRDSGPEPDRWTRGGGGGMGDGGERERRRLVLDPPRGEAAAVEPLKSNKPSPFGAARPREEILAEKGLDWKKLDLEVEAKRTSRPTSSQASRPGSAQSSRSEGPALQQGKEGAVKPRPKVNPFGDAKPREVLLEEKGLDWRKIDLELEHRRIDRPETDAEKNLREEIELLKKELEEDPASNANIESLQRSSEEQVSLQDIMLRKEKELEVLVHELDDKVRFGEKPIQRPGSGAGRNTIIPERLPSQPGSFNESGGAEFMERPRSRGTGDPWIRHGEDRRAAFRGRDRGFLSSRNLNRSRSRERW